jgi:hypothetical protein
LAQCARRPDNWGLKTPEFQRSFIESHLKDAASLKKPVILEECGWAARRALRIYDPRR